MGIQRQIPGQNPFAVKYSEEFKKNSLRKMLFTEINSALKEEGSKARVRKNEIGEYVFNEYYGTQDSKIIQENFIVGKEDCDYVYIVAGNDSVFKIRKLAQAII